MVVTAGRVFSQNYGLNIFRVPDTVLGSEDSALIKTDRFFPQEANILMEELSFSNIIKKDHLGKSSEVEFELEPQEM
jgi:hypothetical protein